MSNEARLDGATETPAKPEPGNTRGKKWLIAGLATVVVICGGVAAAVAFWPEPVPIETPTSTPAPTPTLTPTPTPTPAPPPPTWPLTGVEGMVDKHPAIVVKIENSYDARPQQGIEDADLVFEEMVEGGISRYVAIFHSKLPEQIAPIRSIRPMDGPIAGWTKGVIAFSGGKAVFRDKARSSGLQLLYDTEAFYRINERWAPHDLAADPSVLLAEADKKHQTSPVQFCDFAGVRLSTAQLKGTSTQKLNVEISYIATPNWKWSDKKNVWLRWEDDEKAIVTGGAQISATNILLLEVEVVYLPETDSAGTHVPESIVQGEGKGLLASGGMSVPITWKKTGKTKPWQFFDADGEPITLIPGNTWIELVPTSGNWKVS